MANNVLANKLLPVCVDKLAQNERANIVSKVFLHMTDQFRLLY